MSSFASVYVNVKQFGAKGDGKTDDYLALKKVADYINSKGGGEVYFPPGTYYIGVFHSKNNNFENLEFKNCDSLKISGSHAIISLKGDFNRSADKHNAHTYSFSCSITPLIITNCNNVTISNLEINGNVDKMTRDKDVIETGGHLMIINQSSNLILENLYLHHAHGDGIYITGENLWANNLKAKNVISSNNARQGMSIIKLKNAVFTNCKFVNTGLTDGNYGNHAPSAGVDIEPHPNEKIVVENITFDNCEFSNNKGGQFFVSSPKMTKGIMLENCIINAKNSQSKYTMILAAKDVLVNNCQISCESGNIYPVWRGMPEGSVILSNNNIKSSSQGIIIDSKAKSNSITIKNNLMEFTGNQLTSYFPYLQNENVSFTNNKIYIPSMVFGSRKIQSLVQNAKSSIGNEFYTDNKNIKPKVSYSGTKVIRDK